MTTPAMPAWLEPPNPSARQPMRIIATLSNERGDVTRRVEWEAYHQTTFDAYDAALDRAPWACRIEVKPVNAKRGERHAA